MTPHYLAPTIRDWCAVCKRYVEHDNGYVTMKLFGQLKVREVAATRCWACNWWTRWR